MVDIFGLPPADILDILSEAVGRRIVDASALFASTADLKGICGEYLLPTFTARTEGGQTVDVSLFVRRQQRKSVGNRQAGQYAFLATQMVPVPALYGARVDPDGREIIFLEQLDRIRGSDAEMLRDPGYLQAYLGLIASFSAAVPSDQYIADLGHALGAREYVHNWAVWLPWSAHVVDRLMRSSADGLLGNEIKEYCSRNAPGVGGLKRVAACLMPAIRRLPLGIVHGDLRPQNTGWRKKTRELVAFDFEDIMLDVAAYDVAQVLGSPKPLLEGTRSNDDLIDLYLSRYRQLTRSALARDDFLKDIRIAWTARKINLWELLPMEAGGPSYDRSAFLPTRAERLESLLELLRLLVENSADLAAMLEEVR